ncbi:tyrosine-type recombinase/integrase [Fluviispira sanaruensis]|uniref:Integrase n=1 Tax=Fluviispira sanaruensis TaxID=2493639 RepID=A0A4P2VNJ6_FLUSA|nr:tyrosine-type recombinase/integrase [Fluviispira sanaruensis]BBH54691.1 hypothetical protein JCM31447_31650 [Fluviispira sanaruensis]
MKLENILELFLKNLHTKGASPHTIKAYKLDLLDYLKHLKENEFPEEASPLYSLLIDATSIEFKSYKDFLGQSSPATVQRKFITLRRFLSWCLKEGFRKNPVPDTPKLPSSQPLAPRWLKRNELNSIFRLVEKNGVKRDEVIIVLLYNTGLRISELVDLKWEDIELGRYEGLLKVRKGKGAKMRLVPLNAAARKALLELMTLRKPSDEYLFYGKRGRLTENGILKLFYSLSTELRLGSKNKITPHRLRHTFCKTLLDKKESIEKVSTLAGHSSLSTTQKYITPSIEDLKLSVDSLMD